MGHPSRIQETYTPYVSSPLRPLALRPPLEKRRTRRASYSMPGGRRCGVCLSPTQKLQRKNGAAALALYVAFLDEEVESYLNEGHDLEDLYGQDYSAATPAGSETPTKIKGYHDDLGIAALNPFVTFQQKSLSAEPFKTAALGQLSETRIRHYSLIMTGILFLVGIWALSRGMGGFRLPSR